MAKVQIIPIAALVTVMLASCDLFPDLKPPPDNLIVLAEDSFYAQNMVDGNYYEVQAEMLWESEKCAIWAERGAGVTLKQAQAFAGEYETVIRPRITAAFSRQDDNGDILDYANELVGRNDKKLTVLLMDIKDNFVNPKTDSYVAGYFFNGNFQKKGKIEGTQYYSNGRDMLYIDTNPGLATSPVQTYATFAHELQHLINYVTGVKVNRTPRQMDTWVDEGLSSQAEYLYLGKNPEEKCEWFSSDQEGTIARGNNFFVWDNYKDKPLSILDDYATVYLFFRWLYLQAGTELQSRIFYDIEISTYPDYQAVTNAAREIDPSWYEWENLLRTWFAANYYPKNTYGYTGDNYLQGIIKVKPIAGRTVSLYPGEGVYSIINNSFNPVTASTNIRYAGLAGNAGINTTPPYRENVLLTFNANKSNTTRETGDLTGSSSAIPRTAADARTQRFTGPYVLDARDVLGRNAR